MASFQPRIAIVGGGPAGLALGLLLHRQGIPATIYELRDKPTAEELSKPSGMLDLHEESGLELIRQCDLWDRFQAATGDCAETMRVISSDGAVLHTDEGEHEYRPEIARHALLGMLAEKLPEDSIKWNHKLVEARSVHGVTTGANEITLDFGKKGKPRYDFVVGADGAWSRVRKVFSAIQPFYAGIQFLTVTMRHASTNYPHLVELNGPGTLCALGGGNGLMTHRGPQDSIRVYAAVSTPQHNWAEKMDLKGMSAREVKETLLGDDKLFGKWAPKLQDLLGSACDEETKDNPGGEADISALHMLPIGYHWKHHTGVTLIGDAAHLMTPFAGEGVNLALWDSLDLAHTLAKVPQAADAAAWQAALEPLILEFETAMQNRGEEKAAESDRNKTLMMGENGAQGMADLFKMFEQEATGGPPPSG